MVGPGAGAKNNGQPTENLQGLPVFPEVGMAVLLAGWVTRPTGENFLQALCPQRADEVAF